MLPSGFGFHRPRSRCAPPTLHTSDAKGCHSLVDTATPHLFFTLGLQPPIEPCLDPPTNVPGEVGSRLPSQTKPMGACELLHDYFRPHIGTLDPFQASTTVAGVPVTMPCSRSRPHGLVYGPYEPKNVPNGRGVSKWRGNPDVPLRGSLPASLARKRIICIVMSLNRAGSEPVWSKALWGRVGQWVALYRHGAVAPAWSRAGGL